jgi:hypothetical protein
MLLSTSVMAAGTKQDVHEANDSKKGCQIRKSVSVPSLHTSAGRPRYRERTPDVTTVYPYYYYPLQAMRYDGSIGYPIAEQ